MADGGGGGSSGAAGPSEASEAEEVPDDYICPITAEIMTDPVSTMDGFTYERTAITEWLRTKDTSPFTGTTLESKSLIPNYSLRSVIRSFSLYRLPRHSRGRRRRHRRRPRCLQSDRRLEYHYPKARLVCDCNNTDGISRMP